MIKVLEIGSGIHPYKAQEGEEVIHTDIQKLPHITKILDVNKKFPFKKETFDKVVAYHILEHTKDLNKTMKEIWRVLIPFGLVEVKVPFFPTAGSHFEGHTRSFNTASFDSYDLDKGNTFEIITTPFKKLKVSYVVYNKKRKFGFIYWLLEKVCNKYPDYENLYSVLPFRPEELCFILRKEITP